MGHAQRPRIGQGSIAHPLFTRWFPCALHDCVIVRLVGLSPQSDCVFVATHSLVLFALSGSQPVLYAHLYSYSSVKSVVHWFQVRPSIPLTAVSALLSQCTGDSPVFFSAAVFFSFCSYLTVSLGSDYGSGQVSDV